MYEIIVYYICLHNNIEVETNNDHVYPVNPWKT